VIFVPLERGAAWVEVAALLVRCLVAVEDGSTGCVIAVAGADVLVDVVGSVAAGLVVCGDVDLWTCCR
jgi:hypothetical protein